MKLAIIRVPLQDEGSMKVTTIDRLTVAASDVTAKCKFRLVNFNK